ncbi:hypothetical protein AB9P05_15370 [Roseivirga sp. BDSF3-8]|uniref:PKD domain-containing protein n=1 Tax=Roseivirga sp. BDSF3-8 TaxID=3241598 RepID=UPI00353222F2
MRYSPPAYNGSEPYGLLIYLHGGQAIRSAFNDGSEEPYYAAFYGPPKVIESGRWDNSRKLIVVAPKLPRDTSVPDVNDQEWQLSRIRSVIDDVKASLNIDNDKVYITGISVGGKAVYDMLEAYPNEFAAAFPFSANAPLGNVCSYKDVPIWGFHGNEDGLVLYNDSRDGVRYGTKVVIDAINACSPAPAIPARYTEFDMYDHYGWQQTYEETNGYDIYSYMLAMERNNPANIAPFVTAVGADMSIEERDGTFTLLGRAYDADGTISSLQWTSELSSSPEIDICNANSETLLLDNLEEGFYTFRLTATDNDGATSFDDFNLQVVAAGSYPSEVSALRLVTVGNPSNILQTLEQDAVVNLDDYDLSSVRLDINGEATANNVRYGWDYNRFYEQYFNPRTMKQSRVPNLPELTLGTHYIYAATFANRNNVIPRDTWLQYRIHVVNEPNMTLPTPPDFTATPLSSGTQIEISWSTAGNETNRFEIQRSGCSSQGFTTVSTTSIGQNNYVDGGLSTNETYRYRIRAIDASQFSAYAPQLLVTTTEEPLPVSLMYFNANATRQHVELNWATAKEENHAFFEVQRSDNATEWASIYTESGRGDYEGIRRYAFTDRSPGQGIVYYRLKQEDHDGTTTYSKLARVDMSGLQPAVSFFPNPLNSGEILRADVTGLRNDEEVIMTLHDSRGTQIFYKTLSVARLREFTEWQPGTLKPGIYMLQTNTPAGNFNQRMIVR